jgi:ubiquinol-cytochrome c reductase cytochrome c1 subunit
LIAFLAPFAIGGVFVLALIVGALMPRDAVTPDATLALHKEAKEVSFKSDGAFGTFDKAQLQRGFKVYREVCMACHSLNQVAFRDLAALGFTPAEIKAIAKTNDQPTIDEKTGDAATRPGLPSDKFYGPYANDVAARAANNNALPPDLSLMTKAREHGNRYVYSLLTGYANAPADWKVPPGLYYQMAKDVTAFMIWTAEPKLVERHKTGFGAVIFLLIMTGLGYLSYRRVWAEIKYKTKKGEVASA